MSGKTLPVIFLVAAFAGLFIPFWPLAALAVVAAALAGYRVFSLVLALCLDVLWGAPPGPFGTILFPFVLLSLCFVALNLFARRYMVGKSLPKRLY